MVTPPGDITRGISMLREPKFSRQFLLRLSEMVKDGERRCDACDKEITKGERYFSAIIERDSIPSNANIADAGFTVDFLGNVRLDLCSTCHATMLLSGEEMVN